MQVVYDLETYPNLFSGCFKPVDQPTGCFFEISSRRNDAMDLFRYLTRCKRTIGFNNFRFDWLVLREFIRLFSLSPNITAYQLWQFADRLINAPDDEKFKLIDWNPDIEQIDLFMIHHFDNRAKSTSLKLLEFNMRSRAIEDLPFPPGTIIPPEHFDTVIRYNGHDTLETEKFYHHTLPMIRYRETLGPKWLNYNDTKIGKKYFTHELEAAGVRCFDPDGSPRQTWRPGGVPLSSVIFQWIRFDRPELQTVLDWFRSQTITNTKGSCDTVADLDGFKIHLGLGGIHGSVSRKIIDDRNILDLDVTSYYPSLAIVHRVFPEHLGPAFCDVYGELKRRRTEHAKGTSENATLKLALNGVFGDSNNVHSVFYDPAYMLAITINGQLLLCLLAEWLLAIPGVQLIQVNTDGVTITYPDSSRDRIEATVIRWEHHTGLNLEANLYRRMFIRDVNNYLAEYPSGKVKRVGAYEYKREWHQNHSQLIVPRAVEAAMLHDICPHDYVMQHDDPWDFLLRTKVPRSSRLELGDGTRLQNITRYWISNDGQPLIKIMPPLAGKTGERRMYVHAEGLATHSGSRGAYRCSDCTETFRTIGEFNIHNRLVHSFKVTPCNVFDGEISDINYRYYFQEIDKLILTECLT